MCVRVWLLVRGFGIFGRQEHALLVNDGSGMRDRDKASGRMDWTVGCEEDDDRRLILQMKEAGNIWQNPRERGCVRWQRRTTRPPKAKCWLLLNWSLFAQT